MLISILTSCINFWLHTIQSNKDSLISKAYQEQMIDSGDKCMWLQFVKNILFDLGFSHVWANQSTLNPSALLYSMKTKLKERFISFWKKRLSSEEGMKKLRTYKVIKKNFEIEPYVEILQDKKLRRSLSSFRTSTHRLRIERGRYCGEKPEERLCNFCNIIEDEIHFLCDCKRYLELRCKMFDTINNSNVRYPSLEHSVIFTTLMTSNDQSVIKAVAKFIYECEIT